MILACQNIYKSFATTEILHDISFHIEEQEKAALIGMNGAGKTTLLKIITGEMTADSGQVILARGKTLGYLAQHQDISGGKTIYNEVLEAKQEILAMETRMRLLESQMQAASGEELEKLMLSYTKLTHTFELENGYACRSEVVGVLKGLGFAEEDFQRPLSTLSGGQKTRVALGRLLLAKPDILLLDEPTNHLDMDSTGWLETYLLNYPGAVLIVSHDRYFLDRTVTKVIELEQGKSMVFPGNYTSYSEKKAVIRRAQYNAYMNQQQEIRHQEEVIAKLRSFNREKSIKRAESRVKLLDKMEVLDKPVIPQADMRIHLTPRIVSGNDVLAVTDLSKSFPGCLLFENQSFEIHRGERVAVIGSNGTGKTTLLKMITGLETCDQGKISLGAKVHIGYYDQEHQVLHMDKTVFEEISDTYPTMTQTQIRNVLASFLFIGDEVFQPIRTLSGGERGRVSLAKLMLSEANFLILDEPTNHLDIVSKEILEEALREYTGTVLYVSHDRYFINRTATRILDLTGNRFVNYIGNYDYYLEKKAEISPQETMAGAQISTQEPVSAAQLDWKAQKEEQARLRKKENELKKVETRIAQLEARDKEIDEEFNLPETGLNLPRCQELSKEKATLTQELEELYEQWEELAE